MNGRTAKVLRKYTSAAAGHIIQKREIREQGQMAATFRGVENMIKKKWNNTPHTLRGRLRNRLVNETNKIRQELSRERNASS